MPLLTHDETGATSMARANAVAVAERPPPAQSGPRGPRNPPARKPRTIWARVRSWLWLLLALIVVGPLLAFVIGWVVFPVPTAKDAALAQTATFTFADGSPLAVLRPKDQNRINVTLDKVPVHVRQSVLAAEDRSFYSNPGFDLTGIGRAVYNQLTGGVGGGSTITQQYIKNVTGQNQPTLWRKYQEVVTSVKISKEQTKDQILENYLNTIYFGRSAYGIQAASQAYFGKDVGQLSVAEGAFLAGTIQSPNNTDLARSKARWTYVLGQMVQAGTLTPAAAHQVFPTPRPAQAVTGGVPDDDRFHIYTEAKAELSALDISDKDINTEGLTVTTTIDPARQKAAVDAVARTMDGQPANLRDALVSIDPQTGAIVAYYGGSDGVGRPDYANFGAGRPAGSTFKPFVLSAALQADKGIGLGSVYNGTSGQVFPGTKPIRNSDGDSCTSCNVMSAMTHSINTIFYRIAVTIGPANVVTAAHQAGIPKDLLQQQVDGGISLGNQDVHPIDMASAYATFAADGTRHDPFIVSKVVAADGRVLLDRTATAGANAVPPQVACNVAEAMTDVASNSRIPLSGGRPVAAKTGTVQKDGSTVDNKDTWTVGFTRELSTAVWVGSDGSDAVRTRTGKVAFGVTLAGPIWRTYMNDALSDVPAQKLCDFVPIGVAPPSHGSGGGGSSSDSSQGDSSTPSTDNNNNGGGNNQNDNNQNQKNQDQNNQNQQNNNQNQQNNNNNQQNNNNNQQNNNNNQKNQNQNNQNNNNQNNTTNNNNGGQGSNNNTTGNNPFGDLLDGTDPSG